MIRVATLRAISFLVALPLWMFSVLSDVSAAPCPVKQWMADAQRGIDPDPPGGRASIDCLAVFHLLRYVAQPQGREAEFEQAFPTSREGVHFLLDRIGEHNYSLFATLSRLAVSGDSEAVEKLIGLLHNTDGALAELIADGLSQVASRKPSVLASALTIMPRDATLYVLKSHVVWCIVKNWKDTAQALKPGDAETLRATVMGCKL